MATDISEAGLEKIISDYLVDVNGYELGKAAEFSKEYALDEGRVLRFLQATQPEKVKAAHILDSEYERNKFFVSLRKKLGEAGIIDILRNGSDIWLINSTFTILHPRNKIRWRKHCMPGTFSVSRGR